MTAEKDKPEYLKGINEILLRAYNIQQEERRRKEDISKIKEYVNIDKVYESAEQKARKQIEEKGLEGIVDVDVKARDSSRYVDGVGIVIDRVYYVTFVGKLKNKKISPFTFKYRVRANYENLDEFNDEHNGEKAILESNRRALEEKLNTYFISKSLEKGLDNKS